MIACAHTFSGRGICTLAEDWAWWDSNPRVGLRERRPEQVPLEHPNWPISNRLPGPLGYRPFDRDASSAQAPGAFSFHAYHSLMSCCAEHNKPILGTVLCSFPTRLRVLNSSLVCCKAEHFHFRSSTRQRQGGAGAPAREPGGGLGGVRTSCVDSWLRRWRN